MRVRVVVLKFELAPGLREEPHGIGHLGLHVLEAVRQDDPCVMLLPIDRIADRLGDALRDVGDTHRRRAVLPIGLELDRLEDRRGRVRTNGGEDLEVRPAVLTG